MNPLKQISLIIFLSLSINAFAHDGKDHSKKVHDVTDTLQSTKGESDLHTQEDHLSELNEFPSLHPLVVHFPIMFLIIAALFQIAQFFVFKYELSWLTLVLLVLGFIGAYIAGRYVHPHTHGLSERATHVLKEHDQYADWTVWLSGLGVILKVVSHFILKRKVWAESVVAIILIGAAYSVALAGHHGAELVHIEGVGPQGKFLEKHHKH
jgi:uncharacterized membrane protein